KVKKELNIAENIELAPHTLRRCFATYNAISGMPLPVLQKVLGHSKISTTALYIKDSDLTKKTKYPQNQVITIIEELLEQTKKALVKGEEVRFIGYYSLKTTMTKPRMAMNLQTKKKMKVPSKRVPKYFLYLTYREILKKENKVLFKEKFQAWGGGPFLESVYRQMKLNFKEHESLDCLFEQVEDIEDKTIKSYLSKIHRDYQNSKKKGGEIDFFFQTQDEPELITDCLHEPEIKFTNAISQEIDSKIFTSELFQNLKLTCQEELKELLETDHFHLVKSRHIKEKIEKLVADNYINVEKLCQIPLGKEPRLYGNLQK
ncbi:3687_t:CDS:2, partial [Ambispora gerdemannii]